MTGGRIGLIVGRPDSGKTTYLDQVVRHARTRGICVGGLLSHGLWEEGLKKGFVLEDAASGARRILAGCRPEGDCTLLYGRFYFSPAAFAWGNAILAESAGIGLVVVDEYGPLEQQGVGLWPGIQALLNRHTGPLLLTVRPALRPGLHQRILAYAGL